MAEESPKQQHIYRLSALDQSVTREYIQVAICFQCTDDEVEATIEHLHATVKKTVSHYSILAGHVRFATNTKDAAASNLEVVVALEDISSFAVKYKDLSEAELGHECYHYDGLLEARAPPTALEKSKLVPVPDMDDNGTSAVFAIQASIVSGGDLVVVLALHHSVADVVSIGSIVRCMSGDDPLLDLTNDELSFQAVETSRVRDRLSGAQGAQPTTDDIHAQHTVPASGESDKTSTTSCVLAFRTELIDRLTDLVNARFFDLEGRRIALPVTAFDVLAAMLWKGVTRAQYLSHYTVHLADIEEEEDHMSTVAVPVDIRDRLERKLPDSYFGNAMQCGYNNELVVRLLMPYNISELATISSHIRAATANVTEVDVRSTIAAFNQSDDHSNSIKSGEEVGDTVTITSWEHLLQKEAHLGLGLGEPVFIRKMGAEQTGTACTIHARSSTSTLWDVTVQLSHEAMGRLLNDESFMRNVRYADGEEYHGGRSETNIANENEDARQSALGRLDCGRAPTRFEYGSWREPCE